jgi:hypothetical protein
MNTVLQGVFRRQDEDVRVFSLLPESLKDGEAVQAGKHQVKDYDIIVVYLGKMEALFTVTGHVEGKPLLPEPGSQGGLQPLGVFDEQYFHDTDIMYPYYTPSFIIEIPALRKDYGAGNRRCVFSADIIILR